MSKTVWSERERRYKPVITAGANVFETQPERRRGVAGALIDLAEIILSSSPGGPKFTTEKMGESSGETKSMTGEAAAKQQPKTSPRPWRLGVLLLGRPLLASPEVVAE